MWARRLETADEENVIGREQLRHADLCPNRLNHHNGDIMR